MMNALQVLVEDDQEEQAGYELLNDEGMRYFREFNFHKSNNYKHQTRYYFEIFHLSLELVFLSIAHMIILGLILEYAQQYLDTIRVQEDERTVPTTSYQQTEQHTNRSELHNSQHNSASNNYNLAALNQMMAQINQPRNLAPNFDAANYFNESSRSSTGTQLIMNRLRSRSKAVTLFKKAIPEFWMEILENESPQIFSVMGAFGSLAALIFFRTCKLVKERPDIQDLRSIYNCISKKFSESRREEEGGKYYELKFLIELLDVFNFNISLAKRDIESRQKLEAIMKVFPSMKEIKQSIQKYYTHKDDMIVYKIVLEILTRYNQEFNNPKYLRLRKQVIPFARYFYSSLNDEKFEELQDANKYIKQHYPKMLGFESVEQYLEYYEQLNIELDNFSKGTKKYHCLM